ncbi:MAG: hypothetical protein N2Z23_10600 [Pyrinomonadaceae bacterium]|nr:hypothetical protein [Pyrinomonadaceae bacterium]
MKNLFFSIIFFCCLVSHATGTKDEFLASLPDSHGIILVNVEKLLNGAIPELFNDESQKITEIQQQIRSSSGLDLKEIEKIAISLNFIDTKRFEALVSIRLKQDPRVILEILKAASAGKHKEEVVNGNTVYIFSTKEVLGKTQNNSMLKKIYELVFKNSSDEIAVFTKNNAFIFGSPSFVKSAIVKKDVLKESLIKLLNLKQTPLIAVAGVTPYGLSAIIDLEDDELGKALAGVRQIQGWIDLVNENFSLSLSARTEKNNEAEVIRETLSVFQIMFKGILSSMQGRDKQVYAKMLNNLKIKGQNNLVEMSLEIPKQDIKSLF